MCRPPSLVPLVAPAPQATRRAGALRQARAACGAPAAAPGRASRACSACCRSKRAQAPQPRCPRAPITTASATSVPVTADRCRRVRRIRAAHGSSRSAHFPKETEAQERLREARPWPASRAGQGRAVHREGRQGQPGALSRPLRRLRPERRGSRLQATSSATTSPAWRSRTDASPLRIRRSASASGPKSGGVLSVVGANASAAPRVPR